MILFSKPCIEKSSVCFNNILQLQIIFNPHKNYYSYLSGICSSPLLLWQWEKLEKLELVQLPFFYLRFVGAHFWRNGGIISVRTQIQVNMNALLKMAVRL